MMNYTVELLVNGDPDLLEYYRLAVGRWREIWTRPESSTIISMATMLCDEQTWFEENCGGRWVGQEIMVVAGFGMSTTRRRASGIASNRHSGSTAPSSRASVASTS